MARPNNCWQFTSQKQSLKVNFQAPNRKKREKIHMECEDQLLSYNLLQKLLRLSYILTKSDDESSLPPLLTDRRTLENAEIRFCRFGLAPRLAQATKMIFQPWRLKILRLNTQGSHRKSPEKISYPL